MTTTLLRGGPIFSPSHQSATAMIVADDKIQWIGDAKETRRFAGDVIELDGALVTPAFVDAHVHLSQTGLALDGLDLSGARTLTAALEALAAYARSRSDAILLGFGWDDSTWPEGRPPTGAEVDAAVGDRPVYMSRVDAHSAIVSAAFVARAPDVRTSDGWDGTGRVERAAHHAARDACHRLVTTGQREAALRRALAHAASVGIGCVHEISAPHINPPEDLATIRALAAAGPTIDVVPYWGELGGIQRALELGCVGNAGDLCADGSIGSRTASLLAPYADAPTSGHGYVTAEEVAGHVVECTRAGLQAGFHAIGDGAVTAVVDGMVEAARIVGREAFIAAHHRIEHLEMVTPEQASVLGALDVGASVQPAFDASWGGPDGMYAERLGAARAATMNPFRTLGRHTWLAFGSDSPVTPLDPWGAVKAAVNHHTESERLDPLDAFVDHTLGGWLAARRDDLGELRMGADATYAIWRADNLDRGKNGRRRPLPDLEPGSATPACERTVVHGVTVFEAEGRGPVDTPAHERRWPLSRGRMGTS